MSALPEPSERSCGFDGAACVAPSACHSDRSCRREAEMEARNICVLCDPPRQCADRRGFGVHVRSHDEDVPCPNNCGEQLRPIRVARHLKTCGLVVSSTVPVPDAVTRHRLLRMADRLEGVAAELRIEATRGG